MWYVVTSCSVLFFLEDPEKTETYCTTEIKHGNTAHQKQALLIVALLFCEVRSIYTSYSRNTRATTVDGLCYATFTLRRPYKTWLSLRDHLRLT